MAVYTYDEEANALYILLAAEPDATIARTIALSERLHVDIDGDGHPIGVEILYPTQGSVDLTDVRERFGVDIRLPFTFAA